MTAVLPLAAAVLFGCGTHLLLTRELSRVLIGLALLAHGANLLLIVSARGAGRPTFITGSTGGAGTTGGAVLDPLPQAFALTAIVITFGVTSFLLALAYRSYVLTEDDTVRDDVEDQRVGAIPPADEPPSEETASWADTTGPQADDVRSRDGGDRK